MGVIVISGGDLFAAKADALVNPVNCVGNAGKGLAKVFADRFPSNNKAYMRTCDVCGLTPGGLMAFDRGENMRTQRWILNVATKQHWRDPSQIGWIELAGKQLSRWAVSLGVESIACPALGAGEGGLPWEAVRAAVEAAFVNSAVTVFLYAPHAEEAPAPAPAPSQMGFSWD
jgi:O-acetyl-ADP-ribose deacetylase (regulator of RNase III)